MYDSHGCHFRTPLTAWVSWLEIQSVQLFVFFYALWCLSSCLCSAPSGHQREPQRLCHAHAAFSSGVGVSHICHLQIQEVKSPLQLWFCEKLEGFTIFWQIWVSTCQRLGCIPHYINMIKENCWDSAAISFNPSKWYDNYEAARRDCILWIVEVKFWRTCRICRLVVICTNWFLFLCFWFFNVHLYSVRFFVNY